MLIKKEILAIPQEEVKIKINAGTMEKYIFKAHVEELARSGKVLMVEMFSTGGVKKRFVTDGNNYVFYDYTLEQWNTRTFAGNTIESWNNDWFECDEKSRLIALEYIYPDCDVERYRYCSIKDLCNSIITDKTCEKRRIAAENKAYRIRRHVAMAPTITQEIFKYCKENIFPKYIFFSNLSKKGRRIGTCSHCGKSFRVSKDVKHKGNMNCPRCGCDATLFKKQFAAAAKNKTLLTVCANVDAQLVISNYEIEMWFSTNLKPMYESELKHIQLHLNNERKKIYSYKYISVAYWGYDWYEDRWDSSYFTYVYPSNLKEVFGEKYYNINFQDVLESYKGKVNFIKLLDNLKNHHQAEYLVKLGLVGLTSQMNANDFGEGKSVETVLGINKNLVSLYVKRQVVLGEHRIISVAKNITEDELLEIRKNELDSYTNANIMSILAKISISKFLRYMNKQKELYPATAFSQLVGWYKDYFNMCDELNIHLNKSMKCPKDLKEIHDKLARQLREVQSAEEAIDFKEAIKNLYTIDMNYNADGYSIVLPTCREDFIAEGQSLHHCVGGQGYYNSHKTGKKMIFFIRRSDKINEPFVTLQVDMINKTLIQCYGMNDKLPDEEVTKFVRKFIARLKKSKSKTNGEVSQSSMSA